MLKKLIIKLSIFLTLLIFSDVVVGLVMRKIYFAQVHGANYKTTYLLETANQQIIILGSSRASNNYIDKIIQDSLGLTCYNGGRDGCFISYSNAALNCIFSRYKPKIVVLDVLDDEFEERSYILQDHLSNLLPYYKTHTEIRDIVNLKSSFEKYKLLSSLYTYNSLFWPSINGYLNLNTQSHILNNTKEGYEPLLGTLNEEIKIVDSRYAKLNIIKIKSFKNIIDKCKDYNIKLIIVSPAYKKYFQNVNPTIEEIQKIILSNKNVLFYNYLQDSTFLNNKNYFKDIVHLNNVGSNIFTLSIIDKFKKIIDPK